MDARLGFLFSFCLALLFACGGQGETATPSATSQGAVTTEIAEEIAPLAPLVDDIVEPPGNPVSTVVGGRGSTAGYVGLLGRLSLNEQVSDSVAPAPETFADRHPLTGLPGIVRQRPAAVVKIDNGFGVTPQAGLEVADIVYEEPVEGGLTRLAAVFQSQGSLVGPIRSGRTTDIGIFNSFGQPLYLYSGANVPTDSLLRSFENVSNRDYSTTSGYFREPSRNPPSNVYTSLFDQWATGDEPTPPAQFTFRLDSDSAVGSGVQTFEVNYALNQVLWSWDGTQYLRTQRGATHNDTEGNQLGFDNVIVVGTEVVNTGFVDSTGSTVPEYPFVGSGPAAVYTNGTKISGTWTRSSLSAVATFTTVSGEVIELTPGRTWVHLVSKSSTAL